jgi:hypothetical protein
LFRLGFINLKEDDDSSIQEVVLSLAHLIRYCRKVAEQICGELFKRTISILTKLAARPQAESLAAHDFLLPEIAIAASKYDVIVFPGFCWADHFCSGTSVIEWRIGERRVKKREHTVILMSFIIFIIVNHQPPPVRAGSILGSLGLQ